MTKRQVAPGLILSQVTHISQHLKIMRNRTNTQAKLFAVTDSIKIRHIMHLHNSKQSCIALTEDGPVVVLK